MRWIWIIVVGLALLVLETGVTSRLWPEGAGRPDLMLLFVVFLSLYGPVSDAPISGWLLGMMKDSLSVGHFGLFAVLFLGMGFLISRIRTDIFTESARAHMVNAGVSTLVAYAAAAAWRWSQGEGFVAMAPVVAWVAVWNALLAPPAFYFFFRLSRRLGVSRRQV